MGSANASHIEKVNLATNKPEDAALKINWIMSADYVNHGFDIKAEFGKTRCFDGYNNTAYLQAGYTIAEKWTPFVRYDHYNSEQKLTIAQIEAGDSHAVGPMLYQKSAVLGIDYKFNNAVGAKVENYFNRGYGLMSANNENIVAGDVGYKTRWNMFAASIYFMF